MDEASPEEILTISILINILLSEVTSGNKYGCIFSSSCPFITVWLSFPRCQARSPSPHMTPLFAPSPCPKGAICPRAVTLIFFIIIIIFFLLFCWSKRQSKKETSSLRVSAARRSHRDGKGQDAAQVPAMLLLACNWVSIVITRSIGRLGLSSHPISSLILGEL